MELIVKHFKELTPDLLYDFVQAREKVFLLEQHIVCQDCDDVDRDALHIALVDEGKVLAYLRLFRKDGDVLIGRVLTTDRKKGYGAEVMRFAAEIARDRLGASRILLHSQTYAIPFYEKCGYRVVSEEFLEEGIPHRMMEIRL